MKFYLFPHVTSLNRGCEAIIVSTAQNLKKCKFEDINLLHSNENDDILLISKYLNIKYINKLTIKRYSFKWLINFIRRRILNDPMGVSFSNAKYSYDTYMNGDIYISIGGDNYCYGEPYTFYGIDRLIKSKGKKLVFWGCSIEPSAISDLMKKDLSTFDLIITRESITYEALSMLNLGNEIKLYPDTAFTLKTAKIDLPAKFISKNTIGINVSPLIIGFETNNKIIMMNFISLIEHIIDTTDMQIALIPHVFCETSDDRKPLMELYNNFKHTGRVIIIDSEYNCMELKGLISQCRMFIGARTHATIAAYSTCVPTLVIGYSVKSKGIAKDIFGTYENYVVPVQDLKTEKDLIKSFEWLRDNETSIKMHLQEFMPSYIEKSWQAGNEIKKLAN